MKQIVQIFKNDNPKGKGRNTKKGPKSNTKVKTPKNEREEKKNIPKSKPQS
jgi:hypothetical protein